MTPRSVIAGLAQDMSVTDALDVKPSVAFSRLPLFQTDLDHITGFVLRDDLLLAKARNGGDNKIETLKRTIKTVPGNLSLTNLLEFLLDQRQQIAMVIDEYGGTKGLVTTEDVVETLLGMEIVDEMDTVEDMQSMARRQWAKRARALGLEVNAQGQLPTPANSNETIHSKATTDRSDD